MASTRPYIQGSFRSADDGSNGEGKRPVVFDITGPDGITSILPNDLKLVLHVNPTSFKLSYQKIINRVQTKGGFVEQHWGEGLHSITLEAVTGGFMRLYTGLSNITGDGEDVGGNRRETIAYDKFLDFLALFHNNASIYDDNGNIVFQGRIKISFDGHTHFGWFQSFSVSESAEKPYQFNMSASFTVDQESWNLRTRR